jgi:glutamyl/glutaminyl-tRNA synthetase
LTKLTRIAPTPSGFLHQGNLYSFLLTEKLAAKWGAEILLRIDDMDSARVRDAFLEHVFASLKHLGLAYQHGPRDMTDFKANWRQQLRMEHYHKALSRLKNTGLVYACDCSRKDIQQRGGTDAYDGHCRNKNLPVDAGFNLRVQVPADKVISWQDDAEQMGGWVSVPLGKSGDFVVWRKDALPAYQLSSLVDDVYFGITHVVRGVDLLSSTAMQLYLAELLNEHGFLNTVFHHHDLILDDTGKKLSKSAGNARHSGRLWSREEVFRKLES